jgi:hypothetical protein
LFDEASQALSGISGAVRAYVLSDLAAAAGNPTHAVQIEAAYPDAQAAAWLRLGQYDQAWDAAGRIADPMERSRAQSAIAARWGRADLAGQIGDPTLRDRALSDIAIATDDVVKAARIGSAYYRVQALTGLRQFGQAQAAATELSDGYPLRRLAAELGSQDLQAALAMVELMNREADKAVALQSLAGRGDDELFQRALGMALAARVRGDSLAPVEAALALARSVDGTRAPAALVQAYETASRIVVKYK